MGSGLPKAVKKGSPSKGSKAFGRFIRSVGWLSDGDDKNFERIKCGKALREITNETNGTNKTKETG